MPDRELILGIESSCDETAAAVVADGHTILSNVVHSQIELHKRWRGVVPEMVPGGHHPMLSHPGALAAAVLGR